MNCLLASQPASVGSEGVDITNEYKVDVKVMVKIMVKVNVKFM